MQRHATQPRASARGFVAGDAPSVACELEASIKGLQDVGERSARAERQSPTRARVSTRRVLTRGAHGKCLRGGENGTVGIRVALLLRGDRGHLESTTGTYGASETRSDTQRSVRPAQAIEMPSPPFLDQSCTNMAMCSSVTGSHGRASVGSCTRHVQKHSPTVTRRAVAACRPPAQPDASGNIAQMHGASTDSSRCIGRERSHSVPRPDINHPLFSFFLGKVHGFPNLGGASWARPQCGGSQAREPY